MTVSAALVLTGCGTERADAPTTLKADEVAAAEVSVHALYERIVGEPAQRTAGLRHQHARIQKSVQDCMRRAGMAYQPSTYVDVVAGGSPVDVLADTEWLAPLGRTGLLEEAQRTKVLSDKVWAPGPASGNAYSRLSEPQKRRYGTAISACAKEAAPYERFGLPRQLDPLLAKWHAMVDEADASVPPTAAEDYRTCMAGKGVAVGSYSALVEAVRTRTPPRGLVPSPGQPSNPAWDAAVQFEQHATEADARCRAAGHAAAYSRLAPAVADFEAEHGAELAEIGREWARIAGTPVGRLS